MVGVTDKVEVACKVKVLVAELVGVWVDVTVKLLVAVGVDE
jgi:hypothetical protein